MSYRNESVDGAQVHGRVGRLHQLRRPIDVERGRLISPVESRDTLARSRSSAGTSPTSSSDRLDPIDKTITIARVPLPRRRRAQEEGVGVRQLAGQLRDHPARHLPEDVRLAHVRHAAGGQAAEPRSDRRRRWTTRRVALRVERRLRPKDPDNFGMFTSDTLLGIYHTATNGVFAVLIGVVGAVAGRRRHRDHEHHADGGQRADARDRAAQGARRAPPRHRLADPDRVGHAVDVRRRRRHVLRVRARD